MGVTSDANNTTSKKDQDTHSEQGQQDKNMLGGCHQWYDVPPPVAHGSSNEKQHAQKVITHDEDGNNSGSTTASVSSSVMDASLDDSMRMGDSSSSTTNSMLNLSQLPLSLASSGGATRSPSSSSYPASSQNGSPPTSSIPGEKEAPDDHTNKRTKERQASDRSTSTSPPEEDKEATAAALAMRKGQGGGQQQPPAKKTKHRASSLTLASLLSASRGLPLVESTETSTGKAQPFFPSASVSPPQDLASSSAAVPPFSSLSAALGGPHIQTHAHTLPQEPPPHPSSFSSSTMNQQFATAYPSAAHAASFAAYQQQQLQQSQLQQRHQQYHPPPHHHQPQQEQPPPPPPLSPTQQEGAFGAAYMYQNAGGMGNSEAAAAYAAALAAGQGRGGGARPPLITTYKPTSAAGPPPPPHGGLSGFPSGAIKMGLGGSLLLGGNGGGGGGRGGGGGSHSAGLATVANGGGRGAQNLSMPGSDAHYKKQDTTAAAIGEYAVPRRNNYPREDMLGLTAEEKLERRRERARMYSHMARKRQEANVQELRSQVEALTVYQEMVDDGPDVVLVISPDIESRILFSNAASGRLLQALPATLLGQSFWTFVHEEDKAQVMQVVGALVMAPQMRGHIRCRFRNLAAGSPAESYLNLDVTVRAGKKGLICCLRLAA